MKALFISSGKSGNVGDVVRNQGESLKEAGVNIDYFLIKNGFRGYFTSITRIRKKFRKGNYDLAHAHYSLSGFSAALAGCKPIVVSLMGSDVLMSKLLRVFARFFYKYKWDVTIVKTHKMKELLKMDKALIIPNGVDTKRFKPFPKKKARIYLNYPEDKKIILFISSVNRPEKNLELANKAIKLVNNNKIEFKHVYNVPNSEMPYYFSAADTLLLTSKWEGSPNVIKEAMACNTPIVATDVGDLRSLFGDEAGHFIAGFSPEDIADKIKLALDFAKDTGCTKGSNRIIERSLDSITVAKKIVEVYKEVVNS